MRSAATGKRSDRTALAGTRSPVGTDPRAGTGPFPKPRASSKWFLGTEDRVIVPVFPVLTHLLVPECGYDGYDVDCSAVFVHRPQQQTVVPKKLDDAQGCIGRGIDGAQGTGVRSSGASGLPYPRGISQVALVFFRATSAKGFHIKAQIDQHPAQEFRDQENSKMVKIRNSFLHWPFFSRF